MGGKTEDQFFKECIHPQRRKSTRKSGKKDEELVVILGKKEGGKTYRSGRIPGQLRKKKSSTEKREEPSGKNPPRAIGENNIQASPGTMVRRGMLYMLKPRKKNKKGGVVTPIREDERKSILRELHFLERANRSANKGKSVRLCRKRGKTLPIRREEINLGIFLLGRKKSCPPLGGKMPFLGPLGVEGRRRSDSCSNPGKRGEWLPGEERNPSLKTSKKGGNKLVLGEENACQKEKD